MTGQAFVQNFIFAHIFIGNQRFSMKKVNKT
jgi:hypothetical protein